MKKLENQEVEFQMVIRPIPSTDAYSVVLGEIVDGRFQPTDRWPANHCADFTCLRENPLAPGQNYVLAEELIEVVGPLALEWDSCVLISGFLVFTTKDFPNEKSSKKEE
jgi:hypothetical protein